MLFLYDLGIKLYGFLILLASLKSKKAAAWIRGRKDLLLRIKTEVTPARNRVWFHFASLGEFEQGRPVLEELKSKYPDISIVITFFSPSGYEIRKDYKLADHVYYLPLDTHRNAREFIQLVGPSVAIFTKYEYWYHYFNELNKKQIPLFIVSGIFRNDQPFFRWYGGLHRRMLRQVTHFFVQNDLSKALLERLGLTNVSVTGDTRFDRVVKNTKQVNPIKEIETFCSGYKIFIAGSTWPEDEVLIAALAREQPDWKFIIAPHEVNEAHVREVEKLFVNTLRFSNIDKLDPGIQVLIIDNIGMLSRLYQYADLAYIGGGFGVGIHNTQEASAFGLPVIFGPNYHKFQEAADLIEAGASFSIKNFQELSGRMAYLRDEELRVKLGAIARAYVMGKAGATDMIVRHLEKESLLR